MSDTRRVSARDLVGKQIIGVEFDHGVSDQTGRPYTQLRCLVLEGGLRVYPVVVETGSDYVVEFYRPWGRK